jgi:hypothetical protein
MKFVCYSRVDCLSFDPRFSDGCRARVPVLRFRIHTKIAQGSATAWALVAAFIAHCAKAQEKPSWLFENLDHT